jgi:hypothetical protein
MHRRVLARSDADVRSVTRQAQTDRPMQRASQRTRLHARNKASTAGARRSARCARRISESPATSGSQRTDSPAHFLLKGVHHDLWAPWIVAMSKVLQIRPMKLRIVSPINLL